MFCKSCGKEIGNDMKFCDGCGAPVEQQVNEQPPVNPAPAQQYQQPNPGQQPPVYTQPPVYQQYNTNQQQANTSDSSNKIIFVLSYLGILFFLPLVVCPNSSVGKFHANQGLILLLASIAGSIVLNIISAIIPFFWFLSSLYSLVIFVLVIYGMVNAYNEKQIPLPVIGTLFTLIK